MQDIREIYQSICELTEGNDPGRELNQEDILRLIREEKEISTSDSDVILKEEANNQKRMKLSLESKVSKEVVYNLHIRISINSPENFSVILTLNTPRKNVIIFRANGPHGEPRQDQLHNIHHTHVISSDDVNKRRFTEPNIKEYATYNNLSEAIQYVEELCRISGLVNYVFPQMNSFGIRQLGFDDILEG